MTGWTEYLLVAVLGVADLAVLHRVRRQAATKRLYARQLDELDRLPEFTLSPPDWPIRESPPRELERSR